MKKSLILIAILSIASFAGAVPFDTGATGGTVAVPGDYASLKLAADAFNALAGGINADWTLEITGDLTEPDNVAFGNATNGFTLTIKPQSGKSPTVTFTSISAAGVYTHLALGVKQVTADPVETDCFETTNGYIIDGNNGDTPGTRNLTLTNTAGSITGRIITIFGKTNGVIIRNANIIQADTAGTTWCIRWGGGSVGTLTNIAADGGLIENCYLSCNLNVTGAAINTSPGAITPELAAGSVFNNLEILNNEIVSAQRGIFLDSVGNATIRGNKITLSGRPGYTSSAIFHWDANNYNGYTIDIENNIIDITDPNGTTNGTRAIFIDTITDIDNSGTVNINNNIFKNFTFSATASGDVEYLAMVLNRPRVTYNIEHNSVNMPLSGIVTGVTAGKVAAVSIGSSALVSPVNLSNNLIRMAQTGAGAAVINSQGGVLTAAGNNLVSPGSAPIGIVGATSYADFAAWQGAGYDTAATKGQSVDPASTSPAWDSDLKFMKTGVPAPMIGVASSTILTDIDGEARPATGATPGADEPNVFIPTPLSAQPVWSIYE